VHFDARERLVVEGEAGDSMMLLASGVVAISKSGSEIGAGTVSLAELGEGSYFGEMSLLTGAPRSATVTATEPVEIFVLDREAVAPILARDPRIAETLSHVLAERTAATQARFDDRKEELARLVDTTRHSILARIRGFFALRST
jgi:CRP-like cAMP-binding protein